MFLKLESIENNHNSISSYNISNSSFQDYRLLETKVLKGRINFIDNFVLNDINR
jgi:hypothetical protein